MKKIILILTAFFLMQTPCIDAKKPTSKEKALRIGIRGFEIAAGVGLGLHSLYSFSLTEFLKSLHLWGSLNFNFSTGGFNYPQVGIFSHNAKAAELLLASFLVIDGYKNIKKELATR